MQYERELILVLTCLVLTAFFWRYGEKISHSLWLAKLTAPPLSDLTHSGILEWARSRRSLLLGLEQDQDLLLAEPKWIPTLVAVLGDSETVRLKRVIVVSALMELLVEYLREDHDEYCILPSAAVEIREALVAHADRSKDAQPYLGAITSAVLDVLLGGPIREQEPSEIADLCSKL